MRKSLRFLTIAVALSLAAGPLFADGPGSSDPPPPDNSSKHSDPPCGSATAAAVAALLAYLGL